jgi:hypothetical protein
MDREDISRFGTERAADVAAPLIAEIRDRLEVDLHADDKLALRILSDFANRLFAAGYHFGATEVLASVLDRYPNLEVNVVSNPPDHSGLLGEARFD